MENNMENSMETGLETDAETGLETDAETGMEPAAENAVGKTAAKNTWTEWLRIMLLVFLAAVLFVNRDKLQIQRDYPFMTVSRVSFSEGSDLMVIDQGKAAIEFIENKDGRSVLKRTMHGETLEGFYNAQHVVGDPMTGLYVADIGYDSNENGEMIVYERVVELRNNKDWRVVTEASALMREGTIGTGGSIYDLQLYDGAVWYLWHQGDELNLYRFYPGGEPELMRSVPCTDSLSGASIDLTTGTIAVAAHRGALSVLREDAVNWISLTKDGEHLMCSDVAARAGQVYFTDLYAGRICRATDLDAGKPGMETYFEGEGPLYALTLSEDAQTMLVSDGMAFYRISGEEAEYFSEASVSWFELSVLLWICLVAAALLLLYELRGLPRWLAAQLREESGLRIFLVLVATLVVSGFVIFSLMSELFTQEDESQSNNAELFADLMISKIDRDAISGIQWEDDYDSPDYEAVRNVLDGMILTSFHNNQYYYYILYGLSENAIRYLVNYEDSVFCGEPVSEYGSDYYSDVFDKGERFTIRTQDAYGNWVSTVAPVYGADGSVAAALEVGMDLSYQTAQRREAALNIILSVLCSTVVVLMLLLEVLFLLSFSDKKKALVEAGKRLDGPQRIPLRTLIFCAFLTDSMQEPFIAIVCSQLYQDFLPLPQGVAAALPMSGQLMMMAIFSAIGGNFTGKYGAKKTLAGGFLLQLCGFFFCFLTGTYIGLLVGKLMIGAGMGIVYVTCNTVAATGRSEKAVGAAFADVAAGTISGLTIGTGLASVFLTLGSWRNIYLVGGVILVSALVLTLYSGDVHPHAKGEKEEQVQEDGSVIRFLLNRRVIGFFLLVLVPFTVALSYREYFFPLFSQEYGLSEVRIGQIFLLCGLMVLYTGPQLSAWMIQRFGPAMSVLLGSVVLVLDMLLFVIWPTWISVLIGVVILALVTSFALTCQYSFFEGIPESQRFGEGRAMGVYSVFESLGQTLGPVLYGAALATGYRHGIGVLTGVMLVLTVLFALLMGKDLRRPAQLEEEPD
ncbi:MAG: MFS transporter [Oscillospiraceae bacterium]|nr:MFS transporter [Oscillospiraceae bacterium]